MKIIKQSQLEPKMRKKSVTSIETAFFDGSDGDFLEGSVSFQDFVGVIYFEESTPCQFDQSKLSMVKLEPLRNDFSKKKNMKRRIKKNFGTRFQYNESDSLIPKQLNIQKSNDGLPSFQPPTRPSRRSSMEQLSPFQHLCRRQQRDEDRSSSRIDKESKSCVCDSGVQQAQSNVQESNNDALPSRPSRRDSMDHDHDGKVQWQKQRENKLSTEKKESKNSLYDTVQDSIRHPITKLLNTTKSLNPLLSQRLLTSSLVTSDQRKIM